MPNGLGRSADRLRALASTGDDDASTAVYASGLAPCVGEEAVEEEDARELQKFAEDRQTGESAKKLRGGGKHARVLEPWHGKWVKT